MTLNELFTRLSYGVLSGLSQGGEGSGAIPDVFQPKIATFVNTSLVALYGRFNLLEREVIVRAYSTVHEYHLERKFALMDNTIGPKYIEDYPGNLFTGDVMKILQVFTSYGEELTLNDPGDPTSLYTPGGCTLLVPAAVTNDTYHILYQAKHPRITAGTPVSLTQEIYLPEILVPALEAHVAYQVISPMNGPEHTQKAAEHLARYEMLCGEVDQKDLVSTSLVETHTKLEDRGFI